MQKDVIYIDVEDDITAIIGKVKDSEHKIVALVPPKRTGAIQSAVNLKLVQRAAKAAHKQLVLITNNTALMALAGSTSIPVAKNLQSKPEVAEIPALEIDEGDDVIDGADETETLAGATADDADESGDKETAPIPIEPKSARDGAPVASAKSKSKIPNFDTFRKRLFLIIGGVLLLAGFLVWALVFAPNARITITARTTDSALNSTVSLSDDATTSLKDGKIKTVTKTSKESVSIPFQATGSKNLGERATGTVKFSTYDIRALGTIPAGTTLRHPSGPTFTTNSPVELTAGNALSGVTVGITAAAVGISSNGVSGAVSGAPTGVAASITEPTGGGTDRVVAVVSKSDVEKASEGLAGSSEADAAKQELIDEFGDDYIVLGDTFKQDTSGIKPTPAVDGEATDGKATLAGDIVYTLVAIPKRQVSIYLDAYFAQQIDGMSNQKIYANGIDDVEFTSVNRTSSGLTANISANGKYGPIIDDAAIRTFAKGKRIGDIQTYIREIAGVDDVDIKFSPFWVTTAPGDEAKIRVEFKVNDA